MDDSIGEILEYGLKKLLPLLWSVLLLLITYIPIHLPLSQFLRPDIAMICVYFWALYRRDLFGIFSVVLLGFIGDSLSAVPAGLNIFILMLIYVQTCSFGSLVNTKPFAVSWGGFAVISFLAYLIKWLILSIFYSRFLPFSGVFAGYLATVFLYPLIARLNIAIQNTFLAGEEVIYEQGQ